MRVPLSSDFFSKCQSDKETKQTVFNPIYITDISKYQRDKETKQTVFNPIYITDISKYQRDKETKQTVFNPIYIIDTISHSYVQPSLLGKDRQSSEIKTIKNVARSFNK